MNRDNEVPAKLALFGKISIGIAIMLMLIIGNEFAQVVPTQGTKLQEMLILSPFL